MSKKEKKSKNESRSRKYESESDSSSSGSSASYSESYSSESEEERAPVKKPKLDSSSKKRQKKERKRQEKKKQKKALNKITKEDFYGKSVEFRLWLMEEKKISMEDIKTTKAKAYFKKFVKRWNGGKLSKKYYKGIDAADAKASLTKYKWKFAEKLQASAGGPPSSSNSPFTAGGQPLQRATFSTFGKSSSPEFPQKGTIGPDKPILGPQRPPHLAEAQYEEEEDRDAARARVRAERKKFREDDKLVMEELAPKATGHDAKIEKKLLKRQRRGSPEVSDRVLMGSGMDIDTIMAKKRKSDAARRDRNTELAKVKLTAYQEKEKAKMQALLEMARASKSKDALW